MSSNTSTSAVPSDLVAERRLGWHDFTRATVITCVAVAGVMVLMLLFLRIL